MIDMNEETPSDMSSGIPGMIYTLRQYYDKALAEMSAVDQISRAANTSARTWKRKKVDPAYENALTAISAGSGNVEMQAARNETSKTAGRSTQYGQRATSLYQDSVHVYYLGRKGLDVLAAGRRAE